jgi:hypothetical protein
MFIFLDESGNFTGDKESYFLVGDLLLMTRKEQLRLSANGSIQNFQRKFVIKPKLNFLIQG